jgi:segregation and condensation protein B
MDTNELKNIAEAALLAADQPLSMNQLAALFEEAEAPSHAEIRAALKELESDWDGRGVELKQVASGWRMQVRERYQPWINRLWRERPPRYSRALLETLALIAYRQPITRGEIEQVRGVSVSTSIMRTLQEREWVRIVGHRDVPGRPALYGTSKRFLDYFNLLSLDDLPSLAEIKDIDSLEPELALAAGDPTVLTQPPVKAQTEADGDTETNHEDLTESQDSFTGTDDLPDPDQPQANGDEQAPQDNP